MFEQVRLNRKILKNFDALAEAWNRRDKTLFKQCLFSLELDLNDYKERLKQEHPASSSVIKWYEKLWELN